MPLPPRKADRRSPSHRRSPIAEKERAKKLGGEVVRGSGSGRFEKGDVRKRGILRLEHKTTKHDSFRVTKEMVSKIQAAALSSAEGEVPAIEVEFLDDDGNPQSSVAVVPIWVLEQMGVIE